MLEVIGKAVQKPWSLVRESPPAEGPQLKCTPADPRQEMIVLWLFKLWSGSEDLVPVKGTFLRYLETGVQSNFLLIYSPLEFLTLNQLYRTCVKLSKFENVPHFQMCQ